MRRQVMTVENVLDLANKLDLRAEEYRQPYVDGHIEDQFHLSGSASTWAALRDVAMVLRSLIEPIDGEELEQVEKETSVTMRVWDDCAVEFQQNPEHDGYDVAVLDNEGLIVKTRVHLHEWSGIVTDFINDRDVDGLVNYLIELNKASDGMREGTKIREEDGE